MAKLKITLIKSPIGSIPKQRQTVAALGLRKIRQEKAEKSINIII